MLMVGLSVFVPAPVSGWDVAFLFSHGGIAIVVYLVFYFAIFGREQVKWMFINAGLGILGIYSQIGWILGLFGRNADDYPAYVHVVPVRSEEHTSELQSLMRISYAVFCLKKKTHIEQNNKQTTENQLK